MGALWPALSYYIPPKTLWTPPFSEDQIRLLYRAMDPQVYKAAKDGNIELLRQVVNEDCSRLLKLTPQGNTAIHVSVRFGHIEFIREVYDTLLQHKSSLAGDTDYTRSLSLLTELNSVGDTPLHLAARAGHASTVEFLIGMILPWTSERGDVESRNSSDDQEKEREVAREKIRTRNKRNNTALHEAVRRDDLVMVKLLTEADPHLGHPNYDANFNGGKSPLYLAARDEFLDIIDQIFHICPCPAYHGSDGRTALHVAVLEGHLDVVKKLLEKKGELIHEVDNNRRTALHYAASTRRLKVVQMLLNHDTSSAYELDFYGLSPLHIAALESSISVFKELIQRCPDSTELVGRNGLNVLHFAVMSKDMNKISFALRVPELEELANQPDDEGNTPFHFAAEQGSFRLFGHFISNRRVDAKATNKNGQTANDIFRLVPVKEEQDTIFSLLRLVIMKVLFYLPILTTSRWLRRRIILKGEERWIIGATSMEQIGINLNKHVEVVPGARSDDIQEEKDMGKYYQIVASLIATVTFAAVFQVPGGYSSNDGRPLLLDNTSFQKFLKYDAIAMASSVASLIVMFVVSVGNNNLYSSSLTIARSFIYVALFFTVMAFLEGFRAVLPHCGSSLICFSTGTYSVISMSIIFFPVMALVLFYVPWVSRVFKLGTL